MPNDESHNEDKALFRAMMRDVTPLKHRKKISVETPRQPQNNPAEKNSANQPLQPSMKKKALSSIPPLSSVYSEAVCSEDILSFCSPTLPAKRFQQLKKGEIPFEAVLDLHGFNVDRARESLCHFILEQSSRNTLCILIIHGKGNLRGEKPVIKNHTNHWLRQIPQVLGFHSARPKHGGPGALYVLLKRDKSREV